MAESFVQVNVPATAGKKLKTYESIDGSANVVESEAVTLTDSAGNEVFPATEFTLVAIATILGALQAPVTSVVSAVPASALATVLLAANAARRGATIFNDSADSMMYVKLAAGVSTASYTVRLGPRSFYELPFPAYGGIIEGLWTGPVSGFAAVTELS